MPASIHRDADTATVESAVTAANYRPRSIVARTVIGVSVAVWIWVGRHVWVSGVVRIVIVIRPVVPRRKTHAKAPTSESPAATPATTTPTTPATTTPTTPATTTPTTPAAAMPAATAIP